MKKKDVKLFNKAIHNVKKVTAEIKEERENHKRNFILLRKQHDKRMKSMMKELIQIVNELYILFEDLYNEETDTIK